MRFHSFKFVLQQTAVPVSYLTEAHLNTSYRIFLSIYKEYLRSVPGSDYISEPITFQFS
jgi:hypothetical protein